MELLLSVLLFTGVIVAAVYSIILLISLWRYALGHSVPFIITVVYILSAIGVLGHALFVLSIT